MSLKTIYVLEF